jgi:hypothetical protein
MTTSPLQAPVTSVRHVIGAWAIVLALTLVSWWFGADQSVGSLGTKGIDTAIFAVAFTKMFVISDAFMEQRQAARWLRLTFAGWYLVVCGSLIGAYWA